MNVALLVLQIILSLGIITLVLLQKGEGASAGAAFGGGGGAGSVFGASGSSNFLSKSTAIMATIFFLNSIALAYFAAHRNVTGESIMDKLVAPATQIVAPAVPAKSNKAASTLPVAKDMSTDNVPPPAKEHNTTATATKKNIDTTTTDANVPPPASAPPADGAARK